LAALQQISTLFLATNINIPNSAIPISLDLATNINKRRCAPPPGRLRGQRLLVVPASLSRDIAIEYARVLSSSWVADEITLDAGRPAYWLADSQVDSW
jgi:hypothetical protein